MAPAETKLQKLILIMKRRRSTTKNVRKLIRNRINTLTQDRIILPVSRKRRQRPSSLQVPVVKKGKVGVKGRRVGITTMAMVEARVKRNQRRRANNKWRRMRRRTTAWSDEALSPA